MYICATKSSGCSAVRLARQLRELEVAGSNPVSPTNQSRQQNIVFCCFFVVIALCASPPQNNKKPRTPCVPSALSVWWLVFFNIWLRGQGYCYCSAFSLRFILVVPARSELSAPPFKSSHPDKAGADSRTLVLLFFLLSLRCVQAHRKTTKKPRTPCVPSALSVGRLVFFNIWLRGQGYFYCSAFSLRFILVVPARSELSAPPFESSHPDKTK